MFGFSLILEIPRISIRNQMDLQRMVGCIRMLLTLDKEILRESWVSYMSMNEWIKTNTFLAEVHVAYHGWGILFKQGFYLIKSFCFLPLNFKTHKGYIIFRWCFHCCWCTVFHPHYQCGLITAVVDHQIYGHWDHLQNHHGSKIAI